MNTGKLNGTHNAGLAQSVRRAEVEGRTGADSKSVEQPAAPAQKNDAVNVSSRAAEVQQLSKRAAEFPDVRTGRVEALREQILSNSYRPAASDIADAIIKHEN